MCCVHAVTTELQKQNRDYTKIEPTEDIGKTKKSVESVKSDDKTITRCKKSVVSVVEGSVQ